MRIVRRALAPNEIDHELIWLSVSTVSLGMAAGWLGLGLPWPRCLFHDLTGLPCVTCGMTRSAIAFFHGHFSDALLWNPLIFAFLCGVTVFDLYAFTVIATRTPRLRITFQTEAEKNSARMIVIAALALNWVYLLSHWRKF
jgi:hypothetical protein